jgi:hypothetical protein
MTDTERELKEVNDNARLLLEKYDGVFTKLSEESQKEILKITQLSKDGLDAMTEILENANTSGTFTATLHGRYGSTTSGATFTKEITGYYHKINNRVFIDFHDSLINGAEGSSIGIWKISGLPFEAKNNSYQGSVYGRGLCWKYSDSTSSAFITRVRILANTNEILVEAERTDTWYSGWIAFRSNDSNCRVAHVSISYEVKES